MADIYTQYLAMQFFAIENHCRLITYGPNLQDVWIRETSMWNEKLQACYKWSRIVIEILNGLKSVSHHPRMYVSGPLEYRWVTPTPWKDELSSERIGVSQMWS